MADTSANCKAFRGRFLSLTLMTINQQISPRTCPLLMLILRSYSFRQRVQKDAELTSNSSYNTCLLADRHQQSESDLWLHCQRMIGSKDLANLDLQADWLSGGDCWLSPPLHKWESWETRHQVVLRYLVMMTGRCTQFLFGAPTHLPYDSQMGRSFWRGTSHTVPPAALL